MTLVFAPAAEVIATLKLAPLPGEGGFVRQTWRGETGSAAYYLMTATEFSALHRLKADEIWHFYAGDAIEHVMIDPSSGEVLATRLGIDVAGGELPQLAVPRGVWQGARLAVPRIDEAQEGKTAAAAAGPSTPSKAGWSLIGCTLTPAWNDSDLELGVREALLREFPAAAEWVRALTRVSLK